MRAVTESIGGSALPTQLISCKEGGGGARENVVNKLQVRKCKVLAKITNCSFLNYMFVKGREFSSF